MRRLTAAGFTEVLGVARDQLDLTRQGPVEQWMSGARPEYVILAAAKVGGIHANNTRRAEFIYENLAIQTHVVHAAFQTGVQRLVFLGSSCIYPRDCPQPMREEHLMSGPLEATNEPYAVAKIAGVKLCQAYNDQYGTKYVSLMPTNLYGINDNFDPNTSHVIPAMIRKIHDAHTAGEPAVTLWGTGSPRREFLYVDDLADACLRVLDQPFTHSIINVGSGAEVSIRELAELIADVVGFRGQLVFDAAMPDGTPRKLLDSPRIRSLGWQPTMDLGTGIESVYSWFLKNRCNRAA